MFPILVFVGLEITAQSFQATPARHYPALAFAVLPALAYLATIPLNQALGAREPSPNAATLVQTLHCLANGFIVTSMLWAAALAALLDGRLRRAAVYLFICAACALFGIIHSPLPTAVLGLPRDVLAQLASNSGLPESVRYQTPYHWVGAYGLAAALLLGLSFLPAEKVELEVQENA
jgi:AGZA family xanthine/uracil permease-like MFS transporter